MYILLRKNIIYGGAELLIERMAEALKLKNKEVLVVCNKISPIMMKRFSKIEIKYFVIDKWFSFNEWKNFFNSVCIDLILTTWIHDCIYVDMLRFKHRINFQLIHYIITSDDLILGKSINNYILKKIFFQYYKGIISKINSQRICVYMDEESISLPEKYYGLNISEPTILRLPYHCHELNYDILEDSRTQQFTILTITRADLYMKGYIIGLLDGFEDYLKKHKNVFLEIVTFGKDFSIIKNRIDKFKSDVQSHIILHGQMDYEQLDTVWRHASVYVGMGTTILDAADKGIIPIPVVPYTKHFYSKNLFIDNPVRFTSEELGAEDGYKMIEKVYTMEPITYINNRKIANRYLNEYYNVYGTINKILEIPKIAKYIKSWTTAELLIEKLFLKKDDRCNMKKFKEVMEIS